MIGRNKAGQCIVCGEPTHEVVVKHKPGHPRAGEPAQIGERLPDVTRAQLLLVDGSNTAIDVCADCHDKVEGSLTDIWKSAMEAMSFDRAHWKTDGAKAFTPEQLDTADATCLHLVDNVPVGILYQEPATNA